MRRLIVSSVLLFVVAAAMLHAQKTNFVPATAAWPMWAV